MSNPRDKGFLLDGCSPLSLTEEKSGDTFWPMKEGLYDGEVERRCKLTLVFLTLIQNPLSSSTEKSPGIRPESATSSSPTYMNAIVIKISTIKYCKDGIGHLHPGSPPPNLKPAHQHKPLTAYLLKPPGFKVTLEHNH